MSWSGQTIRIRTSHQQNLKFGTRFSDVDKLLSEYSQLGLFAFINFIQDADSFAGIWELRSIVEQPTILPKLGSIRASPIIASHQRHQGLVKYYSCLDIGRKIGR